MTEEHATPKAEPAKPRMKPAWRAVLIASLALNFAVVGVVGGAILSHDRDDRRHPPRPDSFAGPLTRALSEEDRRAIGRAMRDHFEGQNSERSSRRAVTAALAEAIRAEPFDRARVEGHLAAMKAEMDRGLIVAQEKLIDRLEGMSPEEREGFAERLMAQADRKKGGKKERKWD